MKPLPPRTEGKGKLFLSPASLIPGTGQQVSHPSYHLLLTTPRKYGAMVLPPPPLPCPRPLAEPLGFKVTQDGSSKQMSGAGQHSSVSSTWPGRANSGVGLFQAQEEKRGQPGLWEVSHVREGWCWCLVAKSCPTLATLWTVVRQAPLSMRFSRQEYWSGLPSASPGDLFDPGIKPRSPALQADSLQTEPPEKP